MAHSETTSKRIARPVSRALKKANGSGANAKSRAASALTQAPTKASPGSERVIKTVSQEHHEALKRLVDR